MYTVENITDTDVKINDVIWSLKDFGIAFIPAYCGTTYKYQGACINENHNIYDAEYMTSNDLLVSISRCTNIKQVHCDKVKSYYKPIEFADKCEPIDIIEMKDGYIYMKLNSQMINTTLVRQ